MNQPTERCSEEDCDNMEKSNSALTKPRLIKNLIILSFSYLVSFCASDGLVNLQSTLNKDVGVICLALQYVSGFIAALLLPKYLIRNFGSKIVIFVSMLLYVPYIASNFYPHFSLMVPCSILVGFGVTLIWSSICTYLNDLSIFYSNLCTNKEDLTTVDESVNADNKFKPKIQDRSHFSGCTQKDKNETFNTKPPMNAEDVSLEPNNTHTKNDFTSKYLNIDLKVLENTDNVSRNRLKINVNGETESVIHSFPTEKNFISQNYLTFNSPENDSKKELLTNEMTKLPANPCLQEIQDQTSGIEQTNMVVTTHEQSENGEIFHHKSVILETTIARFFGIFGGIYEISHILNNIISYFVLQNKTEDINYYSNNSCVCGSQFCDVNSECFDHNLQLPSTETKYTLISIYVIMSLLSALCVFFFVDDVQVVRKGIPFSLETALAILKFQKHKNQVLLIPLSLFIGMAQAFLFGDYNKDYVGCAWGVNRVPLVGIACGTALSVFSCLFGWLEKHIGRRTIFLIAAKLNISVHVIMLTWTPDSSEPTMMFVVSGMLGAVIGTMWCHLRAFIGIIFQEEKEAAFASYQVWHAIGCAVCYAYSNYICTYIKIYLLLIVSNIGAICYLLAERNYSRNKNYLM